MHVENLLTLADMEMAGNDDTHQHSERAGSACCASGTDLVRFRLVKRSYRIVLKKGNVGHCFFPNISREAESFMLQKKEDIPMMEEDWGTGSPSCWSRLMHLLISWRLPGTHHLTHT